MTTILVDKRAGVIAADTQCMFGSGIKGKVTKLWVKDKMAVACAGLLEEGLILKDYVFRIMDGEKLDPPVTEETTLLMMDWSSKKPRTMMVGGKHGVITNIEDKFFATGSGGTIAMGAMAAGADFKKALRIANQLDPHTSKSIVYFDGKSIKRK